MKGRNFFGNPFKETVVRLIRNPLVDSETISRAYRSLKLRDRDCMPYVPYLLALESR